MAVAHIALDLRARNQRGDRVDDDDVDGVAADQRLGNLECLLAGVRLGHKQFVDVDADIAPRTSDRVHARRR